MPIVHVTPLGSTGDDVNSAVAQIIDYLQRGTKTPQPNASPSSYYVDSADAPGQWRGRGVAGHQLIGAVDPEQLRQVLLGNHPDTGEQLVGTSGSAERAQRNRTTTVDVNPAGPPDELLTAPQVAALLQTTEHYVRRLARETAAPQHAETGTTKRAALHGTQLDDGSWVFRRDEVERLAARRQQPKVVVAYDVTVSVEKSISLAWVHADDEQRRIIDDAINQGVNAAIAYLEQHAIAVRRGRGSERADGVWAASYRHLTNRNLEPQLHEHVLIANIAAPSSGGTTQAIDARGLMHHAKTAGYVAGAVMRNNLSDQLGVEWNPAFKGISDLSGVPRVAIDAMSTRRREVMSVADELGLDSLASRQYAALATREAKRSPSDWTELEASWKAQLEAVGFSRADWLQLADKARCNIAALTDDEIHGVIQQLAALDGVTRNAGIFGRRDVVQWIIDFDAAHGSNRLDFDLIEQLTDTFLASRDVVPIQVPAHQCVRTGETHWYTTAATLQLEADVIAAYRHGCNQTTSAVPTDIIDAAINAWGHGTGYTLGRDQDVMVRHICATTDRFMIVVGPAGTGKTAALEVAARAWEHAGWNPLGASVTGAATDQLAASTGINTRTVASLLTAIELGQQPLDARTILIVDEASTLSNRDHRALVQAVSDADARMITIGDPAQHTAVEAGGLWAHLTDEFRPRLARLETNRRQATDELTEVRLANADYRNGRIKAALERLTIDNRITSAPTSSQLLDELAADWYVDREQRAQHGGPASRMMAEHHHVRRQLNDRAQTLLRADGTLSGPSITIGDAQFHVGDEVVTRTRDRAIRFDDNTTLRNSSHGVVTAIGTDLHGRATLTVDFEHRGTVELDHDFLTRPIRPGIDGGLTPAYAVTTHVAQGATYKAGRMVATDSSTRAGVYVGLTRGNADVRVYTVRRDELDPAERSDLHLPAIIDTRTANEALANRLTAPEPATVVQAADPDARRLAELARLPIDKLRREAHADHLAARALDAVAQRQALKALNQPPAYVTGAIGTRPPSTSARRPRWDEAATELVHHQTRNGNSDITAIGSLHMRQRIETVASESRNAANVQRMAADLRTARSTLPVEERSANEARAQLQGPISASTREPASYLIAVLGQRPDPADPRAATWTTAATAIETWRHEHGLTPADGASDIGVNALQRALGAAPQGATDELRLEAVEAAVAEAIEAPTPQIQRSMRR